MLKTFIIILVKNALKQPVFILFALCCTLTVLLCCTPPADAPREVVPVGKSGTRTLFKNMLGINAFEWNFLQDPAAPNNADKIFEPRMALIKSFGGVRHYLDWSKIEADKGKYTFNPTASGSWNLDVIYQRCKADGIDVLVCLKTCPDWLLQTYPAGERDNENVPMPYGSDKKLPASYILQAKAAFQFAARYGSNAKVDTTLLSVSRKSRWTNDPVNQLMVGMNTVKYIECDNERDKWWKGEKAHQNGAEYAANLSAFYDGDKGKLGRGVGVKNADPHIQVVMAGLAANDVQYVQEMINWCRQHRGYKADGSVDLCFDVINYHFYANDHLANKKDQGTKGVAPELTEAGSVADEFVKLGNKYHLPVWVTEGGFDINPKSPQRAVAIGDKSAELTQADWLIRTALLYARHGISKNFFYRLDDDNLQNPTQYASSGMINADNTPRPSIRYIAQLKGLLGDYCYRETINASPIIDIYENGIKKIYALTLAGENGGTKFYALKLPGTKKVQIHTFDAHSNTMKSIDREVKGGLLNITISETPLFIELR